MKNALSRIAASTIAHDEVAASVPSTPTSAPSHEAPAAASGSSSDAGAPDNEPESTGGGKRRRRRGGRASSEQSAPTATEGILTVSAPSSTTAPAAASESTAPEADAPVSAAPQRATEPAASAAPDQAAAPTRRRVSSSAPVTPADTTVAILDIPVAVTKREARKAPDADSLLDSVLQALPEPKQPGQGRSRSRRVSSGSISAPATSGETPTDDGAVILGN